MTIKFYYNGIKDEKGAKLQKAHYSKGDLLNYPKDTITIYEEVRCYVPFSKKVKELFEVENNSDVMTDYFETSCIRVVPTHPLYNEVNEAWKKQEARAKARYRA